MKKLLRMLLCAMMIVTMAACGDAQTETPETTVATTEATAAMTEPVTETSTEAVPTARDIYKGAVDKLDGMEALTLNITVVKTTTLGYQSFYEEHNQTLVLQNIGTQQFAASLKDTVFRGDYCTKIEEIFVGDMMYYHVTPMSEYRIVNYVTEMTAQEYQQRMVPVRLLDCELYDTVEQTSASMLAFSEANAPEEWLGISGEDMLDASGHVTLDGEGKICRMIYNVTYAQGSAVIEMRTTVKVSEDAGEEITAPADAADYQVMGPDEYFGPYALYHAIGYISQMDSISSSASEYADSEYIEMSYYRLDTINLFSDGERELAKNTYEIEYGYWDTEEYYYYVLNESFEDGMYTYAYDDEVPVTYELYYYQITDSVQKDAVRVIPDQLDISQFYVGCYGGSILVEYELIDELGEELSDGVAGLLVNDPETLNEIASDYRTDGVVGYVGIDAVTGIPTAVGLDYIGTHTIDGEEYMLTFSLSQSFVVGHESAYEAITGNPVPVENDKGQATPLFYRVTGADGQEMWLLGTIHVGDARTADLPQEINDAFASSDALAVEFDVNSFWEKVSEDDELAAQLAGMYAYTDGTTTYDHISDENVYWLAVKQLKAAGLIELASLPLKPSVWAQYIEEYNMSWNYELSSDKGMDMQLLAMAEAQGKTVLDVESGIEQLGMLTGFSDGLQELLLLSAMAITPLEYADQINEMYELWCAGDEEALINYIKAGTSVDMAEMENYEMTAEEELLYQEYQDVMYADRNADMLEIAKDYLESGDVVFFAVGLAHLLDEDGLVNTLRDAGYTVELVPYS